VNKSLYNSKYLLQPPKRKRFPSWSFAICGIIILGSIFLIATKEEKKRRKTRYIAPPKKILTLEKKEPLYPEIQTITGKIGKNKTLTHALRRKEIPLKEIYKLINSLETFFDFSQSQPHHRFVLKLRESKIISFEYHASPKEIYIANRKNNGSFKISKKKVAVKTLLKMKGGRIETSLFNAVKKLGLHPSIVTYFVDIFAAQINFFIEQRYNDTFKIIAEEELVDKKFFGYKRVLALEYDGLYTGRVRAFLFKDRKGNEDYYDERGYSLARTLLKTPLRYGKISSHFSRARMHPILRRFKAHLGVDYAAPRGTPIWAMADGVITKMGFNKVSGKFIVIQHKHKLSSHYAHLLRFARKLSPGTFVKQRQIIGYVGSSGRSTGPHLHFSLKYRGRFINPLKFKTKPLRKIPPWSQKRFKTKISTLIKKLERIRF
jgi:murein DD-endopeptidase MepM/ murein hydrolase activator NlpD